MDMGDSLTTDRAGGQMYTADLIDRPKLCAGCSVRKSRFDYSVAELKSENPTCAECLLVRAATAAASEPCGDRGNRKHVCCICLLNDDDARVFSDEGEPLMPAMCSACCNMFCGACTDLRSESEKVRRALQIVS
jgi:hypothetical protein